MPRLFVALDLPPHAIEQLANLALDDSSWRRVKPETLHITLAFLGSRPDEDVATITPIITAETHAPHLSFKQVLLLPPRRARVLTVELEHTGLTELQARVSTKLANAGVYTPEKRPFRAHVTVARLRPSVDAPRTADVALEPLSFDGTAVTLYASTLQPSGARYDALVTAPLANH